MLSCPKLDLSSDARVSLSPGCAIYGNKVGAVHETMQDLASDWLLVRNFFSGLSNVLVGFQWLIQEAMVTYRGL